MTRRLITIILLTVAIAAPAVGANDEAGRLTSRLMDMMAKVAAKPESIPKMSVKGGELEVAKHRVRINPVSERALRADGQFISAARFEISLDGSKQDQLTAGSIGIGQSTDEATSKAVEEWYLVFGSALLRSIADSAPDFTQGEFRVYTGALVVRGEPPKDLVSGQAVTKQNVLGAISDALPRADGKPHSVQVIATIAPDGTTTGECRIDGRISAIAFSSVNRLPWPKASAAYMYKRSYVFK